MARGPIKKSVPIVFRTDLSILFELPKSQFNFEISSAEKSFAIEQQKPYWFRFRKSESFYCCCCVVQNYFKKDHFAK